MFTKPKENRLELLAATLALLVVVAMPDLLDFRPSAAQSEAGDRKSFIARGFDVIADVAGSFRRPAIREEQRVDPQSDETCVSEPRLNAECPLAQGEGTVINASACGSIAKPPAAPRPLVISRSLLQG